MKTLQGGFTLIELMIVVAVLGFLVTIGFPAYQNYVIRSKVSEIVVFAASARSTLSEYYMSAGKMPDSVAQASINTDAAQSEFIGAIAFSTTASSATITYTVINLGVTGDIAMVGTATGNGLEWDCSTADTTLGSKYLPMICRG